MRYSFLGIGFIILGMFGLIGLVLFETITVNNESEYYVLREAIEASMLESIDWACYHLEPEEGGCNEDEVKIIEQKFVENFTRRFTASIVGDVTEYKIEFYDIIEKPPKVSVKITGKTGEYFFDSQGENGTSFDIQNSLTGILELSRDKEN